MVLGIVENLLLSFLAPSADENRSITPAREKAMNIIIDIKKGLSKELPDEF